MLRKQYVTADETIVQISTKMETKLTKCTTIKNSADSKQ